MPNKRHGKYNKVGQSTMEASPGSSKKAKYSEKKRSLGPAGNLRPPYESSAPKVKCSTNCNY